MEKESMELAPAAGSGIGKQVAQTLLSREGFIQRLADALDNGLVATRRVWDKDSKDWLVEPDTRSQLQAAFGVMAHMEGEPVKRIIHQHLGGSGQIDPLAALQDSPALRDAARRLLEKSEFRSNSPGPRRSKREQAAEAIEV